MLFVLLKLKNSVHFTNKNKSFCIIFFIAVLKYLKNIYTVGHSFYFACAYVWIQDTRSDYISSLGCVSC